MKSLLTFALIIVFVLPIPLSCNNGGGCDDNDYIVTGLDEVTIEDSFGIFEDTEDTIELTRVAFEVKFAVQITQVSDIGNQSKGSLFSSAQATSPCPEPVAIDEIVRISLVSDNAVNSSFPAGTDLAAELDPTFNETNTASENIPLVVFTDPELGRIGFNVFYLDLDADETRIHNFIMELELTNGGIFRSTIGPVRLLQN